MKILFVSMPSIHVIRWIENLKDANHELYWFDILNRGRLDTLDTVHQFTNWKIRKLPYVKGEYFLSKKVPFLYQKLIPFLEVTENEALEKIILEIQPDMVHSLEMQSCSYPILETMLKFPQIKWLYSCWGSDLFYYMNFKDDNRKIKNIIKRVDFLHTDCKRDFVLAKQLGFSGIHVGVIPGGTGYKINELESYIIPVKERKIILVKGYEHRSGRGLNIIKALHSLQNEIKNYQIIVFGSHSKVVEYIKNNKLNFVYFDRHELSHDKLIKTMGKSLLYIGNSISDGMPNTLLEAIVMGAFPIQSNPGDASAEIIKNGVNGFLIQNPESISEIEGHILNALSDFERLGKAAIENEKIAFEKLDYSINKLKVIEMYKTILNANRI
jgi:glycosyltransferase involved in cell wall biosynthesis